MTGECVMCYSTKQDDLFVVYVNNDYASLLESVFKTEFVTMLAKHYKQEVGQPLPMHFNDRSVSAVNQPFRATMCTPQLLEFIHKKASSYIAQYPVLRTVQSVYTVLPRQPCSLRHHLGFSGKHPATWYN